MVVNTYNVPSNRTRVTDVLGHTTVYNYDRRNERTHIDYPAGTADGAGQRTQMADGLGTTTWIYDLRGRPIIVTDPFSASANALGNRTLVVEGILSSDSLSRMAITSNINDA